MTDETPALPKVPGVPKETYDAPRSGDPMLLKVLRTHLTRCTECRQGQECGRVATLSTVYESGRKYWRDASGV